MSNLVTIFGGSGFVGRYIAQRLAKEGWRIRVAVRRPNEALFVKPYGAVGQVEPVLCNIRDDVSVGQVLSGAQAVVNCVGILDENGPNSFDAVQHSGAERIARLASQENIARLVQISAIGADPESDSDYARTKGLGEAAVQSHVPDAVILRPSIIFGPEDQFFNRFASMARFGPVLPIAGAGTKFQPVYVDDVAKAAVLGVTGTATPGIYELGGPDIATFRELMVQMLAVIRRRRLVFGMPFWMARSMAALFGVGKVVSFGMIQPPITADQVKNLARDNVVGVGARGFAELGITPTSLDAVLPEYLWRFRPQGQYTEITESAENLRD